MDVAGGEQQRVVEVGWVGYYLGLQLQIDLQGRETYNSAHMGKLVHCALAAFVMLWLLWQPFALVWSGLVWSDLALLGTKISQTFFV